MWTVRLDRFGIVAVRSECSGLTIVGCWRLLAIVVGPHCRSLEFALCGRPTSRWPQFRGRP